VVVNLQAISLQVKPPAQLLLVLLPLRLSVEQVQKGRDGVLSPILCFRWRQTRAPRLPHHYDLNEEALFTGDTLFLTGVGRPDLNASLDEGGKEHGLCTDRSAAYASFPRVRLCSLATHRNR
jgi:hypothetical protein